MKAWVVHDLPYMIYTGVVFAETAGKAKQICVVNEDIVGEVEFINVQAHRNKNMDKYYRGNDSMDWFDDDDRLALVRELGVQCRDALESECRNCSAKNECCTYMEYSDEQVGVL